MFDMTGLTQSPSHYTPTQRPGHECSCAERLSAAAGPGTQPSASPPTHSNQRMMTSLGSSTLDQAVYSQHGSDLTSCKIWVMALDLSRICRDITLSNFLSKFSMLFRKRRWHQSDQLCKPSVQPGVLTLLMNVCASLLPPAGLRHQILSADVIDDLQETHGAAVWEHPLHGRWKGWAVQTNSLSQSFHHWQLLLVGKSICD